jgi:hypothetical protein
MGVIKHRLTRPDGTLLISWMTVPVLDDDDEPFPWRYGDHAIQGQVEYWRDEVLIDTYDDFPSADHWLEINAGRWPRIYVRSD